MHTHTHIAACAPLQRCGVYVTHTVLLQTICTKPAECEQKTIESEQEREREREMENKRESVRKSTRAWLQQLR